MPPLLHSHLHRGIATPFRIRTPLSVLVVTRLLTSVVLGRLRWRSLGRDIAFRHASIDDKVGSVHEAALVAGEKKDCLGLFYGFAEAAGWEMDFAAVTLGLIVAKPVLEERCA